MTEEEEILLELMDGIDLKQEEQPNEEEEILGQIMEDTDINKKDSDTPLPEKTKVDPEVKPEVKQEVNDARVEKVVEKEMVEDAPKQELVLKHEIAPKNLDEMKDVAALLLLYQEKYKISKL